MSVLQGLVFATIGLILNVISIGIPYWRIYQNINKTVVTSVDHEGLWISCRKAIGSTQTCYDAVASNWLNACRSMMVIGTVCIVIGIILILFGLRTHKTFRSAGFFVIVGGICCIIAAIVYSGEISRLAVSRLNLGLHVGFGMAIAAGVIASVGGILLVKSTNYSTEYSLI